MNSEINRNEITISAFKANIIAAIFILPLILLFYLPFFWMYGKESILKGFYQINSSHLLILAVGIILHEIINGAVWALFCQNGFKSIKFGIIWKCITPYAHCKEKLKINHYRLGTIMPGFILGFLPAVAGYILADPRCLFIGIIFILGAGGDIIMLWMLRKVRKDKCILDHPDKIGCIIMKCLNSP